MFRIRSLRYLLPLFLTFLVIFEAGAYVVITPSPTERFLELYVLGSNGLAEDYYPNNSSYLQIDQRVTWYLGVTNQMGSMQFVDIRVKLANQTIAAPNDTTATPSPAPVITEFKQFMVSNGTWEIPFQWQILNFTTTPNGYARITKMQIGNATYALQNSPTCSLGSCNFRLIFELWTWNVDFGDFQPGWLSDNQQRIAWLQLWFTLTSGAP